MAEDVLKKIKDRFPQGVIKRIAEKSPERAYVYVKTANIAEVVRYVFNDLGARFSIATGIDTLEAIEIQYHFCFDALGKVVSICVELDRENPVMETTCIGIKATEWIEREISELLGVKFKNHPDMRHLLLTDDWPDGNYPLRRK